MNSKNNLPLVTIAMVTYNQEALVKYAIDSVLAQGYENFELIISDDCSKDKTWEIVNSYNDSRIKTYKTPKNLYQYANRNSVIEKAKGKYLIFIDGDDLIYPHGLFYFVDLMEALPMCGFATAQGYRNNMVFPVIIESKEFLQAHYFDKTFVSTSLTKIFFRTKALRSVGGFSTKYITSDDLCTLTLGLNFPVLVTNHDAAWWRITPSQQSKRVDVIMRLREIWLQTIELFENPKIQLSTEEKYYIKYKLAYAGYRQILKNIITLKWKNAITLFELYGFQLSYLIPPPNNKISLDPFSEYTAYKPMILDNKKNPYSITYDPQFKNDFEKK